MEGSVNQERDRRASFESFHTSDLKAHQSSFRDIAEEISRRSEDTVRVSKEIESSWKSSAYHGFVLKDEKMILDVFWSGPIVVDQTIFSLWLDGLTG